MSEQARSPLPFFALLVLLSIPFWVAGAMIGRLPEVIPLDLPVSALMAVVPAIAALILVARDHRTDGAKRLLRRALDYRRVKEKAWYLPAILLMPAVMILEYAILRFRDVSLPEPRITLQTTIVFVLLFFVSAICEELGWQGYAFPLLAFIIMAPIAGIVILLWGTETLARFRFAHPKFE